MAFDLQPGCAARVPQLPDEVLDYIFTGFLANNEIPSSIRLLNKRFSQRFAGHTRVQLSQHGIPNHAFAHRWGDAQAFRSLCARNRSQLIKLTAKTGDVANLRTVVDNAGLALQPEHMAAAAASGHVTTCLWLRDQGCPWDESVWAAAASSGSLSLCQWLEGEGCPLHPPARCFSRCRQPSPVLQAAARSGSQEVCEWVLTRPQHGGCAEAAAEAARCGHVALMDWLLLQHARQQGQQEQRQDSRAPAAPATASPLLADLEDEDGDEDRQSAGPWRAQVLPRADLRPPWEPQPQQPTAWIQLRHHQPGHLVPVDGCGVHRELLLGAASGCDLATVQRICSEPIATNTGSWPSISHVLPGSVAALKQEVRNTVLERAAASSTPDWREKFTWLRDWLGGAGTDGTCRAAVGCPDALERLRWIVEEQQIQAAADAVEEAASLGKVEVVSYLLHWLAGRPGTGVEAAGCHAAAGGHVGVLQALEAAGWPLGGETLLRAAEVGCVRGVEWLMERQQRQEQQQGGGEQQQRRRGERHEHQGDRGGEAAEGAVVRQGMREGKGEEEGEGAGHSFSADVLEAAASSGSAALLLWLRERGVLWDNIGAAFAGAAGGSSEEGVEALAAAGCPMGVSSVRQPHTCAPPCAV